MKNSRTKVVRIANGSTRKKFKSVDEAKKFIDKGPINLDMGSDCVWIEEEIITHRYTRVDVTNTFSEENKMLVFDYIKEAIKSFKIESNDLINDLLFSLIRRNRDYERKDTECSDFLLLEILKDYLKDDVKAKEVLNKLDWFEKDAEDRLSRGIFSDKIFYDGKRGYDFFSNIKTRFNKSKILLKFLDEIFDNHMSSIKFISTRTNYKPCNSFGIEINGIYVTLRAGDIIFSNSSTTGRNISVTGIYDMINDDIVKMKGFIK